MVLPFIFTNQVTRMFQNASNVTDDVIAGGNRTSVTSPDYGIIVGLAVIGAAGTLSNIAVLAVLLQKKNRQLATNRYLVNLAISESIVCDTNQLMLNLV